MKKCISVFSALVIAFSLFAVCAKGLDADALSAQCAALMCVQTGELLFEKRYLFSRHDIQEISCYCSHEMSSDCSNHMTPVCSNI